jgi:hypothetical protein
VRRLILAVAVALVMVAAMAAPPAGVYQPGT